MFIWLCVRWWYGAGWAYAWQRGVVRRLEWCEGTFAMGSLLRTLFSPFKQTYADNARGSLGVKFRAAIDSLISRVIGFLVRSLLLFAGVICSLFVVVTGFLFMVAWGIIPSLPVIGVALWAMGVGA